MPHTGLIHVKQLHIPVYMHSQFQNGFSTSPGWDERLYCWGEKHKGRGGKVKDSQQFMLLLYKPSSVRGCTLDVVGGRWNSRSHNTIQQNTCDQKINSTVGIQVVMLWSYSYICGPELTEGTHHTYICMQRIYLIASPGTNFPPSQPQPAPAAPLQ